MIEHEPIFYVVIFDGAGNAEQAAHRVARFLRTLIKDELTQAGDPATWIAWVRPMDSYLLGGTKNTFVGLDIPDPRSSQVVGAYAGNSRIYRIGEDGDKIITLESSPDRLGSGRASAKTFRIEVGPYDTLLLMSDWAWVPFGSIYLLRKAVMSVSTQHFSEVPQSILEAATPPDGPLDDMTAVTVHLRKQAYRES